MTDSICVMNNLRVPQQKTKRKTKRGKKLKNLYVESVQGCSRAYREKAMEAAKERGPLWDEETPVTPIPVNTISRFKDIGGLEKLIIIDMLSHGPQYEITKKHLQGVIAREGGKEATEKTVTKYMNRLVEKGYVKRHYIKNGEGGYYRFTIETLFLTPGSRKKYEQERDRVSTLTSLTTGVTEGKPPLESCNFLNTRRLTKSQSNAESVSKFYCRTTGRLENWYGPQKHSDSRKYACHRRKMKEAIFFEEEEIKLEEAKRRKAQPKSSDSPEVNHKARERQERSDEDWKRGQCSANRALDWIEQHPEGRLMGERLLALTNQDEWTGDLARMLFRRWRSGQIKYRHIILLQRSLESHFIKTNMRYLLLNFEEIINQHKDKLSSDARMLAFRVKDFLEGDRTRVLQKIHTAGNALRAEAENRGGVDQSTVDRLTSILPHYAVLSALHMHGLNSLATRYQQTRNVELESEMAKDLAVWELMRMQFKADPEIFAYDKYVLESLKMRENMMLRRECALYTHSFDSILRLV